MNLESERCAAQPAVPATGQSLLDEANAWLAAFERSLRQRETPALYKLFLDDCHWRDLLALTWDVQTVSGRDAVTTALAAVPSRFTPENFRIDPRRTAPRLAAAHRRLDRLCAADRDRRGHRLSRSARAMPAG